MNYIKHYTTLIARSRDRLNFDGYFERHHIVPRCMGGDDNASNIVKLTPNEHYIAHLLLAKIHPTNLKLWSAVVMMKSGINGRSNKVYGWIRRNHAKNLPDLVRDGWANRIGFDDYTTQTQRFWSLYVLDKRTILDIAKSYSVSSGNVRRSILTYAKENLCVTLLKDRDFQIRSEHSKNVRKNISPESEQKRLDAMRRADYTERNKMLSETRKGAGNPMYGRKRIPKIVECIYCYKTGAESQMKRWHFDKCKNKG